MKMDRHNKILEIIGSRMVSTQEELQALLLAEGFSTTQATISRDIRQMRLVKTLSSTGAYCYSVPQPTSGMTSLVSTNSIFLESIKSVDFAGNFAVVKCFAGMANAVCATIDNGKWDNIVGTLAGDDTIFLLLRSEDAAKEFADYILNIIRKTR